MHTNNSMDEFLMWNAFILVQSSARPSWFWNKSFQELYWNYLKNISSVSTNKGKDSSHICNVEFQDKVCLFYQGYANNSRQSAGYITEESLNQQAVQTK